ncbi:hypothetical protein LSCM1_06142 [Leishmania martiniquensis]|uniref:Uncharacterized protein n=1 Tax=Leishmania martiniquensis TaxID=1580590 RepID=A0A836HLB4_9TRYP|nr:hypothetical protein LSCM1_06142 [Leishmania martiniquensis]
MTRFIKAIDALRKHRDAAIRASVLLIVLCVCVPMLAVVPESWPYGATFIAWSLAFAVRAWRFLPWERAYVRKAAHLMADARMRQRGVGKVLMPYTEVPRSLPVVSRSKGDPLPSYSSTEGGVRRLDFLGIRSLSSTVTRRAPAEMEGIGIADTRSGEASGTAAAPSTAYLSASALESSAQFLARAHGSSRKESRGPVANRHAAAATPSRSRSGSDRRASRRSYEPLTLISDAYAPGATGLPEHHGVIRSAETAMPLSMPPSKNATPDTHGYTGDAVEVASLPQLPVLGDAAESSAWPPAELTGMHSNAVTPPSLCSQPPKARQSYPQRGTLPPPTRLEAVLSSPRSSSPQITVLSSTMRLQRISPAVTHDGAC